MKSLLLLLISCFAIGELNAQFESKKIDGTPTTVTEPVHFQIDEIIAPDESAPAIPIHTDLHEKAMSYATVQRAIGKPVIQQISTWNIPSWITGEDIRLAARSFNSPENSALAYIANQSVLFQLNDPENELYILKKISDPDRQLTHIKVQQRKHGIDVFGGECWVHIKSKQPQSLTGRIFPLDQPMPSNFLSVEEAEQIIKDQFDEKWKLESQVNMGYEVDQIKIKLNWYPIENKQEVKLAYVADVYPDFLHRHFIVIDAISGEIISNYLNMCFFGEENTSKVKQPHTCTHDIPKNLNNDRPESSSMENGSTLGNGIDLFGINRSFNVTQISGDFYMLDTERAMFNASASTLPGNPLGAIRTFDALNNPIGNSINYTHVTSSNNSWSDPTTVSAHYNSGRAYEYFLNTHGRNSINGDGGTITSFVHINDENSQPLDNAFWNGEAMFYGDGSQSFRPLARGLDVAGHEISHGVVQNSANLVYENEPGALNESFADVFGAMVDREDWLIGEDVVRTSSFPTGALRNMQDPTQGLSNLNQNGYQPGHYNDRYQGSQDRGGVHINSGIPNRAFYLFATAIGKNKAEEIYYYALTNYLTRTSQFRDCRAAIIQASKDLYGNSECAAAVSAFNQVGISGGDCGGTTQIPVDDLVLEPNPGADLIIFSDDYSETPWLVDGALNILADPLANQRPQSQPSVSDNGSRIVFVNENENIYFIQIDWFASPPEVVESRELAIAGSWRNVAISKDGNRLAATNTGVENTITVIDLTQGSGLIFPLFNPTTSNGGTATDNVLYPDVVEFDYTGNNVIYDALNEITGQNETFQYWDIGVLRAWNNSQADFGDGQITKLFTGIPENVSIGNPSLSKTRPNVMAYDLIEEGFFSDSYFLYATNFETNDTEIVVENTVVSYPNYSRNDDRIIYNSTSFNQSVIKQIGVGTDLISPVGTESIFINDAYFGTWFSNGIRQFNVSTTDQDLESSISLNPNPVEDVLRISLDMNSNNAAHKTVIRSMDGRLIKTETLTDADQQIQIQLSGISTGMYILELHTETGIITKKFSKQ